MNNIVLVCGGRHYGETWDGTTLSYLPSESERAFLDMTLTTLHIFRVFTLLVHGAAKGADTLAEQWAVKNHIKIRSYPAEWARLGKAAGLIRNHEMFNAEKPKLVVGFKGDNGTKNMIDIARRAGVEVLTRRWEY